MLRPQLSNRALAQAVRGLTAVRNSMIGGLPFEPFADFSKSVNRIILRNTPAVRRNRVNYRGQPPFFVAPSARCTGRSLTTKKGD
jgi:hypothetical protein